MTNLPLNVLVVDDSHDAADSMADVLSLHGHRALPTYSAAAALAAMGGEAFDVVLLDVAMPDMDGCQMVEAISQRGAPKRPFLIAVSGYTADDDRQRCLAAGADLFLPKPVDPAVLRGVLARIREFLR